LWKLVSKDRFPKLQDFALEMHSMFGSTHGVRIHFLYYQANKI